MIVLLLVVFGLILGSFVNALVWRLHEGRDWVNERSECPKCHHKLGTKDLVPVLSYLWLKGKCRYCKKPIEDTPLAELLVPALFVISYLFWPLPLEGTGLFQFIIWLVFIVGFVALAIYDLRWFLLPNKIVFPLTGLAILETITRVVVFNEDWRIIIGAASGGLVVGGLFYLLFQMSDGKWIGGGDVKLGAVLGILAGSTLGGAFVLFVASMAGMLSALPALMKGKAHRKSHIPFGPFLILGLIVVQLWGQPVIDWYLNLLV